MRIAKLSLPLKRLATALVLLARPPAMALAAARPDIAARYAALLRLSKALVEAGQSYELAILSNTNHGVSQPCYWNKRRDFFTTNLPGEIPPANGGAK